MKQLEKNPEIYERKETEQVWQGRESHCYFGDNYFRDSQRLDVSLYQSSKKKMYYQNSGRNKFSRGIHFLAMKGSLSKLGTHNCYVFLLTQEKKRRNEQVWTAIAQAKTRAVLVHQTQARE